MLEYFFLHTVTRSYIERHSEEHADFYFLAVKAHYLQKYFFEAFAAICELLVKVFYYVVDLCRIDVSEIVPCVDLFHLWASKWLFTWRSGSCASP